MVRIVSATAWRMRITGVIATMVMAALFMPTLVQACVLDNTASLWTNGVRASLNMGAPVDPSHWAPFAFPKAFASNTVLHLSESRADLTRSLSAATLAAPYRWTFGDGTTVPGHDVTHQYAHPGTYRVTVDGYDKSRGWFPFDNVMITIVAPSQVTQSNLGYEVLGALDLAVPALFWLFDAALVAGALFLVVKAMQGRRTPTRPSSSSETGAQKS